MTQIELPHPARISADKNDIHMNASNAVMLQTGASCPTEVGKFMPSGAGRLCRKLTQNKDFRTVFRCRQLPYSSVAMQNPRSVSDLLSRPGNKLTAFKTRSLQRSLVVEQVRAALPARLAQAVTSAGIDHGRLTIGVLGAVWASRIRYFTDSLRKSVAAAGALEISSVRIRVAQPIPEPAWPRKL